MTQRKHVLPPVDVLRQLLRYEPDTGRLFWLERPREFCFDYRTWKRWNTRYAGTEAFTTTGVRGYRLGSVLDNKVSAHRVAFTLYYGRPPKPGQEIDHIDGNPSNNRIDNLREVSPLENKRNSSRQGRNRSGACGVDRHGPSKLWRAYIGVNGKARHIGYFNTFEEACAARKRAEQDMGFHPNHGRIAHAQTQ